MPENGASDDFQFIDNLKQSKCVYILTMWKENLAHADKNVRTP